MIGRYASLPKQATKAELRQRALNCLYNFPDPSKVTAQQLAAVSGVKIEMAEGVLAGVPDLDEPTPCAGCDGQGRVWKYRVDDQRYPVPCNECGGSGVSAEFVEKHLAARMGE